MRLRMHSSARLFLLLRRSGFRGLAVITIAAAGSALLSGCSLFRPVEPENGFATYAIMTEGEVKADLEARTTTRALLTGGGVGAAGGAVAGATAGGAAAVGTGPFALIFVPAGALVGGAIGLVAGGTVGAVAGGLQGLPAQKAERVTEILTGIAGSRDFQKELVEAVTRAVPSQRRAEPERAEAIVIVRLTRLELDQSMSDEIALQLNAKLTLTWGPPEKPLSREYDYDYETPDRHVDEWLADDGAPFSVAITESIDAIAGDISEKLLSF